jgi:flagellar basal-body rod protein FlgB
MATTPMLQALEGFLKVTTDRQQLVATNMANVDTPGYHTRDIDFQAALEQALDEGGSAHLTPASLDVPDLPERPDGNNVNIDRESMILAQTQLMHQMGVQLVKAEFHQLLTAIKD